MKKILVLGIGNDCRSQMMEGWLRYYAGTDAEIFSAGHTPVKVNMLAVKVMMDAMIDITAYKSKGFDELPCIGFDYIINMAEEKGKEMIANSEGNPIVIEKTSQCCSSLEGDEKDLLILLAAVRDSIEDFCFDFVNENIRGLIPGDLNNYKKSLRNG